MSAVTNAVGLTRPEVQQPSGMADIGTQAGIWRGIASGATPGPAQQQGAISANRAMGNTLSILGSQKGFSASNIGNIAGHVGANQQMEAKAAGDLAGLQERQMANQNLSSLLMGQAGLQQKTDIANAELESAQAGRLGKTIAGLGAAGAAGWGSGGLEKAGKAYLS